MQIIDTREDLIAFAQKYGLRDSWHEPDEQGVDAVVKGSVFDNAGFWPWPEAATWGRTQEKHVVLKVNGKPVAAVNLATLFAFATGWEGED
jgi:hypothetical protein